MLRDFHTADMRDYHPIQTGGNGLDDRVIEARFPAQARDFSSNLCVQTGSGAHPASCTMGTRGSVSGVKRDRGVTLTTHPHPVLRSWMSRSYTSSSPSWISIYVLWDCFYKQVGTSNIIVKVAPTVSLRSWDPISVSECSYCVSDTCISKSLNETLGSHCCECKDNYKFFW
jgi:hypothetical protein